MIDAYKNDFEKFLAHTNEKKILSREILVESKKYKAETLLDIGAGNGLLAVPLAKHFKSYLAVEPNENFAENLVAAGLKIICAPFPSKIGGEFDMVLASHVVGYRPELLHAFIEAAWEKVKIGGILLVITLRGQEDDWTKLIRNIGENKIDTNQIIFNELIEKLYSLGTVKMRKVTTTVDTTTLPDMLEALTFVASDGKPKKKKNFLSHRARLEKIINSEYRKSDGYSFPFTHYFLTTIKG